MEEYYNYLKKIKDLIEENVDAEYNKVKKFIERKIFILEQQNDKFSDNYLFLLQKEINMMNNYRSEKKAEF